MGPNSKDPALKGSRSASYKASSESQFSTCVSPYSVEVKGTDPGARLVSCETVDMLLNLSEPQLSYLQNGNGNRGVKSLNDCED